MTQHSLLTRALHFSLALAVVHQLIVGSVMTVPRGIRAGDGFWQAHQVVGVVTLLILVAFWGWATVRRHGTRLGSLYPWLSTRGRKALRLDIIALASGLRTLRLPESTDHPVASSMHGLGLLAATLMTVSGAMFFLKGHVPEIVLWIALNIHAATANLMWAYLVAHAGVAALHEMLGHRVVRRMLPIGGRDA